MEEEEEEDYEVCAGVLAEAMPECDAPDLEDMLAFAAAMPEND
jgi:hypothetical protein